MKKPTLVVMAAGMGSRFGGLKQVTAVDEQGNSIIHYSLYDACRAGFGKVVFVINHKIEADFKEKIGEGVLKSMEVAYAYQELDKLPEGIQIPEGRVKPWGTAHAVLCAAEHIDGPFAVINADDFYGFGAYKAIGEFLQQPRPDNEYVMVGYQLRNAMTENGSVSRGVCSLRDGYLMGVTERTKIEKRGDDAAFTEDGVNFTPLSGDTIISMNMWGFTPRILEDMRRRFKEFLLENLEKNPERCEFYLPLVADAQIKEGLGTIRVLETDENWYGVTYREDLASVKEAIARMHKEGKYPEILFP